MLKVKIKTPKGNVVQEIDFPEKLSEVKLFQFTEFEAAFAERERWLAKWDDKDISGPTFALEYLTWSMDLLEAFLKLPKNTAPIGDWKAHIKKISQGDEFDYRGIEGNVLSLLANVYRVASSYERKTDFSEDYTFIHHGVKYTLSSTDRDLVTGKENFHDIESARVIEALKIYDAYTKKRHEDKNGNFLYTSLLYAIACFSKAPGEKFPDKQSQITMHVNSRVRLFSDIDMETGLNASAFFLNTLDYRMKTQLKNIFGTHPDELIQLLRTQWSTPEPSTSTKR